MGRGLGERKTRFPGRGEMKIRCHCNPHHSPQQDARRPPAARSPAARDHGGLTVSEQAQPARGRAGPRARRGRGPIGRALNSQLRTYDAPRSFQPPPRGAGFGSRRGFRAASAARRDFRRAASCYRRAARFRRAAASASRSGFLKVEKKKIKKKDK